MNRGSARSSDENIIFSLLLVAACVTILIILIGGYYGQWEWTGFNERTKEPEGSLPMRTLWDWQDLLIVPLVLAIAGWWLSKEQKDREQKAQKKQKEHDEHLEAERARNNLLQAYLDDVTQILLSDKASATNGNAREVVVKAVLEARTATVLLGLDGDGARKRHVTKFLYELGLINRGKVQNNIGCIDLWSADFNGADLEEAILPEVFLKDVYLRGAKLNHANLNNADLRNADLRHTELRGTWLSGADLSGADLRDTKYLTQDQIRQAKGDEETQLPDNLHRPQPWNSRSEQVPKPTTHRFN